MLFDYGLTLVHFRRPAASIRRAERAIGARIAAAGYRPPPLVVLRDHVHDRVEHEVLAHGVSGALQEIDIDEVERIAFEAVGLDLDAGLRDDCSMLLQEAWIDGVMPYADALPALRALRESGLRLGVCSNAPYRPAGMHAQLHHLGIARYLDGAVFSAEVGWRKPDPRMFSAALEAVGADAATTLFVGDRPHEDVRGARSVGMRTARILRSASGRSATVPAATADLTLTTLQALPKLLQSWPSR